MPKRPLQFWLDGWTICVSGYEHQDTPNDSCNRTEEDPPAELSTITGKQHGLEYPKQTSFDSCVGVPGQAKANLGGAPN